ncbi:MAG: DUF92 domain-containing protein [Thermoanaerobaculia bacterium]
MESTSEISSPPHSRSESLRKLIHIGVGFFAVTLAWLNVWEAAAAALAAFFFNWLLLPRLLGDRIARHERGHDPGILYYPLAVLALILVFARHPAMAGAIWVILAFGDGAATLIGRNLPIFRLPWNREKSLGGILGFFEVGFPSALAIYLFLGPPPSIIPPAIVILVTTLACALVETLALEVNDNITVPLTGALVLWGLTHIQSLTMQPFDRGLYLWIGVNTLLALTGWILRSVDLSGMIGGWLLGTIIIVFGGWALYVALLVFFVIGSGATKLGYQRKGQKGLAQEKGGRRGFAHAFANVGVAAILALLMTTSSFDPHLLWIAAVASLATAAADTAGSEIGQLLGEHAFLPLSFRRVAPGTEGAISLEGTVAGWTAALIVSVFAVAAASFGGFVEGGGGRGAMFVPRAGESAGLSFWSVVGVVVISAAAGSWIESVVGSWNRKRSRAVPNGALNFLNTAIGAAIAIALVLAFR